MDTFQTPPINTVADRFKIGRKWFGIGIVVAFFNAAAGLIFGIALVVEKEHRREGLILIVFSVVWALILYFGIIPWLT